MADVFLASLLQSLEVSARVDPWIKCRLYSYWYHKSGAADKYIYEFQNAHRKVRKLLGDQEMARVFLAGEGLGTKDRVAPHLKNRLFSYWYHKNCREGGVIGGQLKHGTKLFLDSGAFTAFTKGVSIDNAEFIDFYKGWPKGTWDLVAAVDVIGNAEASWENYEIIRKSIPSVLPTFHYGEPFEFLEKMVKEAKYIALGGVAQLGGGQKLLDWFDHVWGTYLVNRDGTAKVKVHGFAVTNVSAMTRYPWESVDSSSWIMTSSFGNVMLFNKNNKPIKICFSSDSPNITKADGWHFDRLPNAQRDEVLKILAEEHGGVAPELLAEDYVERHIVNARSFQSLADRIPKTFHPKSKGLFA